MRQNEKGDTVRMVQVTDRTRASRHDRVREREESVAVRTDTVFVASEVVEREVEVRRESWWWLVVAGLGVGVVLVVTPRLLLRRRCA